MIHDRLVCGINDARIQEGYFKGETLTYADAIKIAQAVEVAAKDIQDLSQQGQYTLRSPDVNQMSTVQCYRCGRNHYTTQCSFKENTCHTCKKKGHLARMWRSCKKGSPPQGSTHPHKQVSAHSNKKPPSLHQQVPPVKLQTTPCLHYLGT